MNLTARNSTDFLVMGLFILNTPAERLESDLDHGLIASIGEQFKLIQTTPEWGIIATSAQNLGYIDEEGNLTKFGQFRAIQMFKSGQKEKNQDFKELTKKQDMGALFALLSATVTALKERVESKESFTPSESVRELLIQSADALDTIAGEAPVVA